MAEVILLIQPQCGQQRNRPLHLAYNPGISTLFLRIEIIALCQFYHLATDQLRQFFSSQLYLTDNLGEIIVSVIVGGQLTQFFGTLAVFVEYHNIIFLDSSSVRLPAAYHRATSSSHAATAYHR